MIRRPAVAGQFYPSSKKELEEELEGLIVSAKKKLGAKGAISPHAGYIYSGGVAGRVFGSIQPKSLYIIIGPNHTGMGAPFSVDTRKIWQTPIGPAEVEVQLAKRLLEDSKYLEEDTDAHTFEHSVEVQLPFIQYSGKPFKFIPIVVSSADIRTYKEIALEITRPIKEAKLEDGVVIIASSDMTHYESQESAKKKDMAAIDAVLKLDEEALDRVVRQMDISMCGVAPGCVMLAAAKALGAKSAELIDYKTSGEASGDYSSVVGYAGVVVI